MMFDIPFPNIHFSFLLLCRYICTQMLCTPDTIMMVQLQTSLKQGLAIIIISILAQSKIISTYAKRSPVL